jgi:hypothetical protein
MDEFVIRANIELFRGLIANETDLAKRRLLEEMLADEMAKLAEGARPAETPPGSAGAPGPAF